MHPTVEEGEIKGKTAQKVIIAKEMNFKTPRRTLLQDLRSWGEKKHHIRGTIQLASRPSVGRGAPGRNQKFCPIKEVFKDEMFSPPSSPLPSPFIHRQCLQGRHSQMHRYEMKINKLN